MAGNSVVGLYRTPEGAAAATGALREAGFTNRQYDILSSSPYPEEVFGEHVSDHRLFVYPIVGAICGFAGGIMVTAGTQLSYPLVTGGKPILSVPPMLVITYEGTMLGAILFTILGLIFESRLPNLAGGAYDPRIMREGMVGVVVGGDQSAVDKAATVLRSNGAEDVVYEKPGGKA